MRLKKYNLLFIIALFLVVIISSTTSVFATSEINVEAVKNQITPLEQASYKVTITNNDPTAKSYSIYSFVQGWTIDPSPLSDKIIQLAGKQSYTTTLKAQPTDNFPPGIYTLSFTVESDTGERYNQAMKIYLSPETEADYLPAIRATVDMDEKIDPNEPVSIKLFLENRNPLDLSGLVVKIQSDMPEFQKEVTVDIAPLDRKSVEFSIIPNPYQQPKDYTLFFVFEHRGETAKIQEQKVEIISVVPGFKATSEQEFVALKKFVTLSVKNPGNVANTQDVRYPVSFWDALLTRGADDIDWSLDQTYLVWSTSLAPNETKIFQYTTNYRLPIYLLVILIALAIFYYSVKSPIEIRKTAVTTKSDEGGALSEIKIKMEVLNNSKKPLSHITITDVVPSIANVEKSLELGTLKPHEIRHTKHGTKVIWTLAELDVHEHRLITYKVRAKLNILGTFQLPRAGVEFKKGKRKQKAYSNVVRLNA